LWLAPEQYSLLPISERFNDYCKEVQQKLAVHDIRGTIDDRAETIGKKIRQAELSKVPLMLIIGEKEVNDGMVSVRIQGEGDKGSMSLDDFVSFFKERL
ncbi:MAG: threonine--tRNA ligase, partial [Saprospiraceae bacterium]|nr:threonine--tRNA ligase [Saprospiraceae bacterium]